jgi:hypothetical protein
LKKTADRDGQCQRHDGFSDLRYTVRHEGTS